MGTTSQKLQYLTTTKGKIKDAINLTNANILSEDTFRSYAEKLKLGLIDIINNGTSDLYDSFPKTTGTGTEIALNDTYEAPMEIGLKGNTEQTTYTGINKVRVLDKEQTTINNITYSVTDGIISWSGTASRNTGMLIEFNDITLPAGTYYFYLLRTKTTRVDISLRTTNNVMIDVANFGNAFQNTLSNKSFTLSSDTVMHSMNLYFPNGTDTTDTYKIMICTASHTATEYEPFVGGIPSPNPDYPQPVKVVTGNNTINVCGKNLYGTAIETDSVTGSSNNVITDTSNKLEIQGISGFYSGIYKKYQLKPNTQYTISLKYSELSNGSKNRIYYKLGNNCKNIQVNNRDGYIDIETTTTSLTFTTDNTGLVAILFCCNWTVNTGYIVYNDIQLEQGTTASDYEEYQSQSYAVNLGTIELCKIGDYQDYIYKENNKWYKHSEIGKVVLDGSESWVMNTNQTYFLYNNNIFPMSSSGNDIYPMYSTHFISNKFDLIYSGSIDYGIAFAYNARRIVIRNKDMATAVDLKAWLSTHNTIVYYVLATPTNTEITDTDLIEQLEELEKTKSVDDKTFISQINADLPFIISASALSKN